MHPTIAASAAKLPQIRSTAAASGNYLIASAFDVEMEPMQEGTRDDQDEQA
jgi:hypothetical protein